jgi:hypothetical protein
MSNHTNGPWEVGRFHYPDSGRVGTCEITPVGEFEILAHAYLPAEGRSGYEEGRSNSHLIAAAPELLYALTMVRDADDDCARDGLAQIPSVARSVIDSAIAKAEGKP